MSLCYKGVTLEASSNKISSREIPTKEPVIGTHWIECR